MNTEGMSEGQLLALVILLAWLVLVLSGYRARRVGARTMVLHALVWAAIFMAVALLFTRIGSA